MQDHKKDRTVQLAINQHPPITSSIQIAVRRAVKCLVLKTMSKYDRHQMQKEVKDMRYINDRQIFFLRLTMRDQLEAIRRITKFPLHKGRSRFQACALIRRNSKGSGKKIH